MTSGNRTTAPFSTAPFSTAPFSTAPFSLIGFDLDGTAIDSGTGEMSPRVRAALEHCHAQGTQIAVASGRPLSMLGWLEHAGFVDWLVLLNGSLVIRRSDHQVLFTQPLTNEQVYSVMDRLEDLRPAWVGFFPRASYRENRGIAYMTEPGRAPIMPGVHGVEEMKAAMAGSTWIDDLTEVMRATDELICKFEFVCAHESEVPEVTRRLQDLDLDVVHVGPGEFEVTAPGVNKGTALARICREQGLDPRAAVGFGDGGNDVSIVGNLGTFVAMANAAPRIRAAADDVCPSISEDGIAVWLEARMG